MARRFPVLSYGLVLFAVSFPSLAAGDPVTGGFGATGHAGGVRGGGGATDGAVRISISTVEGGFEAFCWPCSIGTQVSLSGIFSEMNGGVVFLDSPAFVLPDMAPSQQYTVVKPFSFLAIGPNPAALGNVSLSGGGTATGVFRTWDLQGHGTVVYFVQASFVIGPEPAVTPEPASLMLFGTGAAALWTQRRRRPQVSREGQSTTTLSH